MSITQEFETKGYVLLKDFLDKDNCKELTDILKNLVKQNKTVNDIQCPKSEAIYANPTFDKLLEDLLPNIEHASGRKLYPTYAYARLYAPTDELKIHTDRPSCQISATITLGYEGEQWSIYMADDKNETNKSEIQMDVGDAVLYKGMEKYHWRKEFKGKWQAQVFLHYVDANGIYSHHKYDGRKKLSHHPSNDQMYCWIFDDCFAKDALNKIIESCEKNTLIDAAIGDDDNNCVNKNIRNTNRISLPTHRGIGATLAGMALSANHEAWQFDIDCANQTDYLQYTENGHYVSHIDTFMNKNEQTYRKLTTVLILNDDFEGGKFYLQFGHEKFYPKQTVGTVIVFPSFLLHGVEPVTKGIRRTIVSWMVGKWFK